MASGAARQPPKLPSFRHGEGRGGASAGSLVARRRASAALPRGRRGAGSAGRGAAPCVFASAAHGRANSLIERRLFRFRADRTCVAQPDSGFRQGAPTATVSSCADEAERLATDRAGNRLRTRDARRQQTPPVWPIPLLVRLQRNSIVVAAAAKNRRPPRPVKKGGLLAARAGAAFSPRLSPA